jgi:glycosyltransferase involved in cell wall biosynthesis
MGNSPAHFFVDDLLQARPGVVVFHDLALGSYHYEKATRRGAGLDDFRRALHESHPDRAAELDRYLSLWSADPAAMVRSLTDAGLDINRRLVAQAKAVIVHSRSAAARLGIAGAGKTFVVPHGAEALSRPIAPDERAAARDRLGLPTGALVVASFGIIHPSKRNAEAVEAFAAVARAVPGSMLLFVGGEADDGLARLRADSLGMSGRVRFLGRADDARFLALIAAADVGVSLRRPPTNGETSGALLHLLRAGVPAVVSDIGSFAEYPDGAVRKVPWADDASGVAALSAALLELAADPTARDALGRAGLEHVRARHAWADVAARYAEVIEWSAGSAGTLFRGPHRKASTARPSEPSERGER